VGSYNFIPVSRILSSILPAIESILSLISKSFMNDYWF
jgi:hypothetical protein